MDDRILDRREFTLRSALVLLSGAAITVSGCAGRGEASDAERPGVRWPDGGPSWTEGSVAGNHGHHAAITGAQLMAGGSLSLNIRGSASHPHTVDLTAREVMSIASGQRVSKSSSDEDAHTHTVTFN
jgi:hypothetical protein